MDVARDTDVGPSSGRKSLSLLLVAAVIALANAQPVTARADEGSLQPLNTFTVLRAPRLEHHIAPDAKTVRTGDMEQRLSFLNAVVVWLSKNYDLPARFEHPTIKFVPAQAIVAMRYGAFINDPGNVAAVQGDVVSIYNTETQTIYLRDNWQGMTPADVSVLIHEMVHHLQTLARLKFACPQEREQVAIRAQQRWLGAFDTDIEREFELDAFSLFINSSCGF